MAPRWTKPWPEGLLHSAPCNHLFMDATQLKQSSICYGWVSCDVGMVDWMQRIGCRSSIAKLKIGPTNQVKHGSAMDQTMAWRASAPCKHLFVDATQLKQSSICYGWVSCDVGMADWMRDGVQNWKLAPNQVKHGSAVRDGDGRTSINLKIHTRDILCTFFCGFSTYFWVHAPQEMCMWTHINNIWKELSLKIHRCTILHTCDGHCMCIMHLPVFDARRSIWHRIRESDASFLHHILTSYWVCPSLICAFHLNCEDSMQEQSSSTVFVYYMHLRDCSTTRNIKTTKRATDRQKLE